MRLFKKLFIAALCFLLVLSLASCQESESGIGEDKNSGENSENSGALSENDASSGEDADSTGLEGSVYTYEDELKGLRTMLESYDYDSLSAYNKQLYDKLFNTPHDPAWDMEPGALCDIVPYNGEGAKLGMYLGCYSKLLGNYYAMADENESGVIAGIFDGIDFSQMEEVSVDDKSISTPTAAEFTVFKDGYEYRVNLLSGERASAVEVVFPDMSKRRFTGPLEAIESLYGTDISTAILSNSTDPETTAQVSSIENPDKKATLARAATAEIVAILDGVAFTTDEYNGWGNEFSYKLETADAVYKLNDNFTVFSREAAGETKTYQLLSDSAIIGAYLSGFING